MSDASSDRLMTVSEVADYLTVSVPTIWRWLRDGKLTGMKIGNSRRFRSSEVIRFAAAGATGTREAAPACGAPTETRTEIVLDALPDVVGMGIVAELRARILGGGSAYPATEALQEIRRDRPDSLWDLRERGVH